MEDVIVSIVTGTYNRLESLQRMMKSARASLGMGIRYEFVIADGGSTDGTQAWLKTQPNVVLQEQGALLGINVAFQRIFPLATGAYLVIANDDVEFLCDGIANAVAFMQDHPGVGVGCFRQNRYDKEAYTVEYIPALQEGQSVRKPYGQVCIVPRWLGEAVNWWSDEYKHYAGDCELSCNILEKGYDIVPLPDSCINDYVIQDALRANNSRREGLTHSLPDSDRWRARWSHPDGTFGPRLPAAPTEPNPLERWPRLVYAPIYHKITMNCFQKTGLREALKTHFLVQEVDYRSDPVELLYTCQNFQPDVVLCQMQVAEPDYLPLVKLLRKDHPNAYFVNWNGDYHPSIHYAEPYQQLLHQFDLCLFSHYDSLSFYRQRGIRCDYWQASYELERYYPPLEDRYDVLFLGNGYSKHRLKMASLLRALPQTRVGLYGAWEKSLKPDGYNLYDFMAGRKLYRSTRIALGDQQFPTAVAYASNRMFEALSAGAFLLQQHIEGLTEHLGYVDGKHLVLWKTLEELPELIAYWLAHPRERNRIAKAGMQFTRAHHSFACRVEEFLSWIPSSYLNR